MELKNNNVFSLLHMIRVSFLGCLFLILSIIKISIAAEWDNAIGVGFNVGYVDNIRLAPPGDEDSQYVAQISPFISLNGEGGRARFDLTYQMQYFKYQSSEIDSQIYHRLFSTANAEFIEQFFYLDLSASNFQSAITDAASIPQDNVSITDNRTNVTTTTVSPYIQSRVFSKVNLLLRYTLNNTTFDDIGILDPDTQNESYEGELSSIDTLANWRLAYARNEFNTNLVESSYFEEASFRLAYNKYPQLVPFITIGTESNQIENTTFEEGDYFWNAGLTWRPTLHTTISASHGERFYGTTNAFSWITDGRVFDINVNYTEEITNAGNVFSGQPPPADTPPGAENEFIPISVRPFIRKRIVTNLNYDYSKTTINWYLFGENRDFLSGPPSEDTTYGSTLSWDWALFARTGSTLSATWQRVQSDLPINSDNRLWNINLGVSHITSERITSSITYRYLKQDSNNPSNNYVQNSINAGLIITFDDR